MIGATVLLAVAAAIAKWQAAIYPVGEVMFFRSLSALVVCAAVILPVTGLAVFATQRPGAHIARGLSQSISQTFTVIAFSLMPLAGAVAISFSAPLWAALLSILWLKERAGPARWTVLLTGFSGVLIVTNPGVDAFQIGALFALANAIMYGSVTVAVRGMTATESANTLLMWQMVTMTRLPQPPAGCSASAGRRAADAAMLAFSGVANAAAQYAWTKALLLAPTSAVSPFYYLMLVWAMVIGFVVWGDVPTTGAAHRIGDRGRVRAVPALARGATRDASGATGSSTGGREASICACSRSDRGLAIDHSAMSAGTFSIGTAGENR